MARFTSTQAIATVCVALLGLVNPVSAGGGRTVLRVKAHQKIQPVIDGAPAGAKIIVDGGTYAEQLSIGTDGIELIGRDGAVILTPPNSPASNPCSGLVGKNLEAGICIHGSGIQLQPDDNVQEHLKFISATTLVKGVSVTGFTVQGFSGLNVAILAAEDTQVSRNKLIDGQRYGALTVGSKNSKLSRNVVSSTVEKLLFIGMCVDDQATPRVSDNNISGYNIALCVQTAAAQVRNNDVYDCCIGAFVDPGIVGAQLRGNYVGPPNPNCVDATLNPGGFGTYGIFILGANNTVVRDNDIEGQSLLGREPSAAWFSAGIAVFDLVFDLPPPSPPFVALANGNEIKRNTLTNNNVDIIVDSKGVNNVALLNECANGIPATACS